MTRLPNNPNYPPGVRPFDADGSEEPMTATIERRSSTEYRYEGGVITCHLEYVDGRESYSADWRWGDRSDSTSSYAELRDAQDEAERAVDRAIGEAGELPERWDGQS